MVRTKELEKMIGRVIIWSSSGIQIHTVSIKTLNRRRSCDANDVVTPSTSLFNQYFEVSDVPNWLHATIEIDRFQKNSRFYSTVICIIVMQAIQRRWISTLSAVKGMRDLVGVEAYRFSQVSIQILKWTLDHRYYESRMWTVWSGTHCYISSILMTTAP